MLLLKNKKADNPCGNPQELSASKSKKAQNIPIDYYKDFLHSIVVVKFRETKETKKAKD